MSQNRNKIGKDQKVKDAKNITEGIQNSISQAVYSLEWKQTLQS